MTQYLKNNLRTILLTLALMLVSGLLWSIYQTARISDTFPLGFPFRFYLAWGPCPPGRSCYEFNLFNLILDFILWYGISAFVFRRVRN